MNRDDLFQRHGITWQRHWVGDNSGMYVWRAEGRRLEVWRCGWDVQRRIVDGTPREEVIPDYRATVDGRLVGQSRDLRATMDAAAIEWRRSRVAA